MRLVIAAEEARSRAKCNRGGMNAKSPLSSLLLLLSYADAD